MSYGEINWPKNAKIGDVYQGPNGRYWIFDGCAWSATCCPPVAGCDYITNGILMSLGVIGIQYDSPASYLQINLVYVGDDSYGNPVYQYRTITDGPNKNSYIFTVIFNQDLGEWAAYISYVGMNGAGDFGLYATLPGVAANGEISGSWVLNGYVDQLFYDVYSQCGADNGLCVSQNVDGYTYTFTFNPLKTDPLDQSLVTFISPEGPILIWDSMTSSWYFIYDAAGDLYQIPGTQDQLPIGEYLGTPIGDLYINSGSCSCNPQTDGVTAALIDNVSSSIIYFLLQFTGTDVNGYPKYAYDYCFGGTDGYQVSIQHNNTTSKWEMIFSNGVYSGGVFIPVGSATLSTSDYFYLGDQWTAPVSPEFGSGILTFCGPFIEPFCFTVATGDDIPVVRTYSVFPSIGLNPIPTGEFGYTIASSQPVGYITWNGSNWVGVVPGYASPQINIAFLGSPSEFNNPIGSWSNDGGLSSVVTSEGPCTFDNPPL